MTSASDLSRLSCSLFFMYRSLTSAVHAARMERPPAVLSADMARQKLDVVIELVMLLN